MASTNDITPTNEGKVPSEPVKPTTTKPSAAPAGAVGASAAKPTAPRGKLARFKAYLRRKWWLVLILFILVCVGGYFGYLALTDSAGHQSNKVQHQAAAKPQKTASPLTGLPVSSEEAHRWPVAAMIENSTDARPQSGLSKAGLVYEAFAEGGITRYMAVFLEGDTAGTVGPVRSARPYYVDWADELHAIYVHAGGSPGALALIPTTSVIDMNGLLGGIDTAFQRISSRVAPHNLYTTLDNIRAKAKANGADISNPSIPTFLYRDDLKEAQHPESAEVDINWGGSYAVKWTYNKATDDYTRILAGQSDVDAANNKPITARNIIIQTVPQSLISSDPKNRLDIGTVGTGAAKVCSEGGCTAGTWKKVDGQKTRFYDATGSEIKLVRGATWIEETPSWVVAG